ncbi:MAG: amidohydrolase [Peptococcaceae bacterium]
MVKNLAEKYHDFIVALRREFHMHPEPSFKEFRTSQRIKEELEALGIPFETVGETGVVGVVRGEQPGKTIALRADMDALELQESNDIEYKSKQDGYMHGCGHDAHTAMLLGAGKILNEVKESLQGKVKLIFQPAEEVALGAKMMVEAGVLEDVDETFAIHVWANLPAGQISVDPGPRMAATDVFKLIFTGKGGHGSAPHEGIDAIVAASSFVMNVQSIVSREISPLDSVVVSVGIFNSGTRFNVIASEAYLEGGTRYFSREMAATIPQMIERIAQNTAAAYRAEVKFEYIYGTPPCINHEASAARAAASVKKLFGEEAVVSQEKVTGGEDFAFFVEKIPGAIAFLGCKNPQKQADFPHHHPRFNIDEDVLSRGAALYAQYALDYLNN